MWPLFFANLLFTFVQVSLRVIVSEYGSPEGGFIAYGIVMMLSLMFGGKEEGRFVGAVSIASMFMFDVAAPLVWSHNTMTAALAGFLVCLGATAAADCRVRYNCDKGNVAILFLAAIPAFGLVIGLLAGLVRGILWVVWARNLRIVHKNHMATQ
jgi:hypothetical protein